MEEIFPDGFDELRKWIAYKASIRFGPMSPEPKEQQPFIILQELCKRLCQSRQGWSIAIADDGTRWPTPQAVWLQSPDKLRRMLKTGRVELSWYGQPKSWRIGIRRDLELTQRYIPRPTEAERIATLEKAQRASKSLSNVPGGSLEAGICLPAQHRTPEPVQRPGVVQQKRDTKRIWDNYATGLPANTKLTIDGLLDYAKMTLRYLPARRRAEEWLSRPDNRKFKSAPGEKQHHRPKAPR